MSSRPLTYFTKRPLSPSAAPHVGAPALDPGYDVFKVQCRWQLHGPGSSKPAIPSTWESANFQEKKLYQAEPVFAVNIKKKKIEKYGHKVIKL